MRFDKEYFDAGINRLGTRCAKWDSCRMEHGDGVLPMWVADMDFPSPPACMEALLRRAAHPTYGYTAVMDDDYQAVADYWKRRHMLEIGTDEIIMLPCVVTGLKLAVRALTGPDDGVAIFSPVYGPFRGAIEAVGRKVFEIPMPYDEAGRYRMDIEALDRALTDGARLVLFCSPHNPVSRLWSKEELQELLSTVNRHGAYLVSDEIHADFVYPGNTFTPILSLQKERVMSLCAASKTFNLAGLQQASCLCADPELRKRMAGTMNAAGIISGNIFALEATRAAYMYGDEWLDGLVAYLDGNRKEITGMVKSELPQAVLTPIEATYLAWLDMSALGFDSAEIVRRAEKAGLIVISGKFFGDTGEYHLRLNFACPRRLLAEGVARLKAAMG